MYFSKTFWKNKMKKITLTWICLWILCDHGHAQNLSESCQQDFDIYQAAEAAGEPWSDLMMDANGKPEAGVSAGNLIFEGDFNTCNNAMENASDPDSIRGVYCLSWWQGNNKSVSLTKGFGFCIPHRCTDEDALLLTDKFNPHEEPVIKNMATFYCSRGKSLLHDGGAIVSILVLVSFGMITIVATAYDIGYVRRCNEQDKVMSEILVDKNDMRASGTPQLDTFLKSSKEDDTIHLEKEKISFKDTADGEIDSVANECTNNSKATYGEDSKGATNYKTREKDATVSAKMEQPADTCDSDASKGIQLLLCFSLYRNIPRLVSTRHPQGSYTSLHGIRFLAMAWILLGHTFLVGVTIIDSPVLANKDELEKNTFERFGFEAINQMILSVETFFILSGLLATLSFLRTLDKKLVTARLMVCHYFHRYWRLTPVYAIVLMFGINLLPYLADGPFFNPKRPLTYSCSYWWMKLLYIDNLLPSFPFCMVWGWYLTCDFQFYVVAPLFIWIGYKCWKKNAPIWGGIIILSGYIGSLIINIVLHLLITYQKIPGSYDNLISFRPWTRATSYFLGMTLGYALYVTKAKATLSKITLAVGWVIALTLISTSVFVDHFFRCPSFDPTACGSRPGVAIFTSVRSSLFAFGVIWIVFVCMTGNGGLVHRILSWKLWLPLSRLTYVVYLVHEIFQFLFAFVLPVQMYYYNWLLINLFVAHLVFSLATAFVLTLVFEVPFAGVEKVLRKKEQ